MYFCKSKLFIYVLTFHLEQWHGGPFYSVVSGGVIFGARDDIVSTCIRRTNDTYIYVRGGDRKDVGRRSTGGVSHPPGRPL
jgi:hypothetical protein